MSGMSIGEVTTESDKNRGCFGNSQYWKLF